MNGEDISFERLSDSIFAAVSKAHRFGTDAFLLADFASPRHKDRVIDLCSGCGIVGLLMIRDSGPESVTAVEIADEAHALAVMSKEKSGLENFMPIKIDLKDFTADVQADMTVRCARCGKRLARHLEPRYTATLQADPEDADSEEIFPLEGDGADVSDILESCFILDTDQKYLCREDCKGLCPTCGKDLNDGPCGCKQQIDPRMAVLGRLLDDIQEV